MDKEDITKEEFYEFLDKILSKYQQKRDWDMFCHMNWLRILEDDDTLKKLSGEEYEKLNHYALAHYKTDFLIKINGYREIKNEYGKNRIILKTEVGSFLLVIPESEEKREKIFHFINKKRNYNILELYSFLSNINRIWYSDTLLYYTASYLWYKSVTGIKFSKAYYRGLLNHYDYSIDRSCPLEYLDDTSLNTSILYNNNYGKLENIYDFYYRFDKNLDLVFKMAVHNQYGKYNNIINKHLPEFKQFVFNIASNSNSLYTSRWVRTVFAYLEKNKLYSLFTEEELRQLYLYNPGAYFLEMKLKKLKLTDEFKNNSPMIRLNSREKTRVHIKYRDYDLCDCKPVAYLKAQGNDFIHYFLSNNSTVVKLYQVYYNSYKKLIKENLEKDNLEDFIKTLLRPKNLAQIFSCGKFDWDDLESSSSFSEYFKDGTEVAISQVRENLRNRSLKFYNEMVRASGSLEDMNACLKKFHLSKDTIYQAIIEDKFLYSKEKGGLLNIVNRYYGNSLKVLDILVLMDEMLTREMTIDEILKEKEIPKKNFYEIYQKASLDNPILYQYIFESLSKNKRRGYLKLIRLGYKVLNTPITSREEYDQKFGSVISFDELLPPLEKTALYQQLLDKTNSWPDFANCNVKKRVPKK